MAPKTRFATAGVLSVALAVIASAAAGRTPPSTDAKPSAAIVFARGSDVYVTSLDGRYVKKLARHAGQPSVSANGAKIAFVRDDSIWVMERDGSRQRRLTSGHEDITPAWSPDGMLIYFSRLVDGKDEYGGYEFASPIYRVNADGSGLRRLTQPEASDHGTCHDSPAVSPNGREIVFAIFDECDRGYAIGISAIGPNGKPVQLGRFDMTDAGFDPAWSPDGRSLAFATLDDWQGNTGVAVAQAGRSPATHIYRRGAGDPAWSPDGQWIAFVRTSGGRGRIWLVRRDGTGLRRLSSRRYDADPAWLPTVR